MQKPEQIRFTGLTLKPGPTLNKMIHQGSFNMISSDWARLTFTVPTAKDSIQHVYDWLNTNCNGQYTAYRFHDRDSYSEYQMVVRFEDKNDAIMFKLQDGHRAWEYAENK